MIMEKRKTNTVDAFRTCCPSANFNLTKIMISFTSVLIEVIKEPADGFLVVVVLLAFNDNLREK